MWIKSETHTQRAGFQVCFSAIPFKKKKYLLLQLNLQKLILNWNYWIKFTEWISTVKFLSKVCSPGFLLSLYLLDDALHPGRQVSHHGEKAELLSCVHQSCPAAVAGVQQALPGFYHFSLCCLDVVRSGPCILSMKPWRRLLELLNLEKNQESNHCNL